MKKKKIKDGWIKHKTYKHKKGKYGTTMIPIKSKKENETTTL